MNLDSLTELFVEELKDVYDAEKQLLKALPKMSKAASSEKLRKAFDLHAKQTRGQVGRLDRVFKTLDMKPSGKPCEGMKGIIAEAEALLSEEKKTDPAVLDAGLIAAAQRAEHYEMATYGTLRTYAETMGKKGAAKLLQQTLDEETKTDRKLSDLAVSSVNLKATGEAKTANRGRKSPAMQRSKSTRRANSHGKDDAKARATTNHDEIRSWVEERGGRPAAVKGTGKRGEAGLLRIDFPGYSGGDSLKPITWQEFFRKFDKEKLTFLHQDETKSGKRSNFNKLICSK